MRKPPAPAPVLHWPKLFEGEVHTSHGYGYSHGYGNSDGYGDGNGYGDGDGYGYRGDGNG